MAERGDSEGSDLEINIDENDDNLDGNDQNQIDDPLQRAQDDDLLYDVLFGDGEEEDFEGFDQLWKMDDFRPVEAAPIFRRVPGAQILHPPEARALDYFELFYTQEIWERLVTETNRYYDQQHHANPPHRPWEPVTVDVMKAFIGLTLSMGIMKLPSRHDYWRKKKFIFATNFSDIMSRDRFDMIWRYLHLQDNSVPDQDPLRKLRWFITCLVNKFKSVYVPNEHVAVDESMVKFKGRLGFRQYLPSKPIKWGLKVWSLCESATGYAWNLQVYTGRVAGQQERGLSYRVVMDLIEDLQGSWMKVYMDNFYTSTELFEGLRARGLLACGTVRANRKGLPAQILPRNVGAMQRGEYRVAQKNNLVCVVWMDTKPVIALSNYHSPTDRGTVQRRRAQEGRADVEVPLILEHYQRHMRGVDLCDQMTGYYLLEHRSNKWWRRLYFYLQMVAVHNSYVVAKDSHPDIVQQRWPALQDFIEDLAMDLIGEVRAARAAPVVAVPQRAGALHEIVLLFDKFKTCRECAIRAGAHQRRGVTKYGCRQCREPVHKTKDCVAHHTRRHLNL